MKKVLYVICAMLLSGVTAFQFTSCNNSEDENIPPRITELRFNINVNNASAPDTKAVKSDWEDGDKLFVFFKVDGTTFLDAIKYVTLSYNGSTGKWDGACSDALTDPAELGSAGKMYAVYFPFGGVAIASDPNNSGGVTFRTSGSKNSALDGFPIYTFYMNGYASYTISTAGDVATLDGTFDMKLPANYVYFYVDKAGDKFNENEKYRLAVEGVVPVACVSYFKGAFMETPQDYDTFTREGNLGRFIGQPMWGYKYHDGIAFSGKINTQVNYASWGSGSYWGGSEAVDHKLIFFSDGDPAVTKTINAKLASHASVKLLSPVKGTNGWVQAVTTPTTTLLNGTKWANWNLGAEDVNDLGYYLRWGGLIVPKDYRAQGYLTERNIGKSLQNSGYEIFDAARAYLGADWRMPTKAEFDQLSNYTISWIAVGNTTETVGPTIENSLTYIPNPTNPVHSTDAGMKVEKDGHSIFLPVSGYKNGETGLSGTNQGVYWCSDYYSSTASYRYRFYKSTWHSTDKNGTREYGQLIRPIKKN